LRTLRRRGELGHRYGLLTVAQRVLVAGRPHRLPSGHSSPDPVTALLVITGRLSQWPAIARGRLTFTGHRPELGPRFADLFVFP
jgi:hypothetical protein